MKTCFFAFILAGSVTTGYSQGDSIEPVSPRRLEHALSQDEKLLFYTNGEMPEQKSEHPRITAALLCITLGPFGAHRLYLGTEPIVPAAYTLTLGGGIGVLPVIDLFLIVFSKDISKYKNNPHIFMWNRE